uniref:Lon N-terminal domain-containing protein n=1 Tax=Pseudo-nitzschia australis TaxID=44445 RepID=A0A7S4EQR8_9STRA|mmetsp:Transcript_1541/g.3413  ORF Transcript_1541/g.3413 Transcript_1541/m.3413 type:complete len:396 (+) Transcript_1541:113-1300(+)|eukprot:CAMPEP_0168226026 /NCGR_PEP_ID=MMETSP0140_2-20121125/13141_1 /TAXON_ID=44445 /ORGANISM="Pseudo-nitzschia australis, Strain 10249 10 AB" /LENGTH=395 /DNA_ID=CAMNT_0008156981 /DNA_START=191 /DNA_END=1378 /DNA_ORIENTATION=-
MKILLIDRRPSKRCHYYRLRILTAFLVIVQAQCFVPKHLPSSLPSPYKKYLLGKKASIGAHPTLAATIRHDDCDDDLLPMSSFDRKKFHHMKTRGRIMPIIFMGEPLVPGQRLYFRSGDPKFEELIKYIAHIEQNSTDSGARRAANCIEIGIMAFDPQSGQVLHTGVTAPVQTKNFAYSLTAENQEKAITTSFKGTRFFRLVGDPWMDPSGSFHMAHIEILDGRYDDENLAQRGQIQIDSDKLFSQVPALVDDWMELMFAAGLATPVSLREAVREIIADDRQQQQPQQERLQRRSNNTRCRTHHRNNNYALYPPRRQKDRAIWVIALLNPIRRYPIPVSNEIRPAFLACLNDRDRLALCVEALYTSLRFLQEFIEAKRRGGFGKSGEGGDGVGHT